MQNPILHIDRVADSYGFIDKSDADSWASHDAKGAPGRRVAVPHLKLMKAYTGRQHAFFSHTQKDRNMNSSMVLISLGALVLPFVVYLRLTAHALGHDQFPTVPRPKNAPNPIENALKNGYDTVREYLNTAIYYWQTVKFIKPLEKPFFILLWTKKLLILPPKYLADVRRADREHLQFQPAVSGMFFQYRWLGDSIKTEPNQIFVMKGINPQLRTIIAVKFAISN